MKYYLYILTCADGTYYTGITNNIEHRMEAHRLGKGSKYVRAHLPFEVSYVVECSSKSDALKLEIRIKDMSREQKAALIAHNR